MNINAVKREVWLQFDYKFLPHSFFPRGHPTGAAADGKPVHFPLSQELRMGRQHDSGLTEKKANIKQQLSAPQLWAILFSPPLFHGALTVSWSCSQIPQVIVFPQPQELQPAEAAVPEGSSSPPCGLQLIFHHFPGGQRCSEWVLPTTHIFILSHHP